MKQEVNIAVTDILSSIIKETRNTWITLPKYSITKQEFLSRKRPVIDVQQIASSNILVLPADLNKMRLVKDILQADRYSNYSAYAANSYMDWHTNSDLPGLRTYYTFTKHPAIFRYEDPDTGKLIEDYDDIGWTVRQFIVSPDKHLWHSIWCEGIRFAFGFNTAH